MRYINPLISSLYAIIVVGLFTGCASHRIDLVNTSHSFESVQLAQSSIPPENRSPAYLNVRIFHGDLDECEVYPNPTAVTKFGMFLAGTSKRHIAQYTDIPLESLEELDLFSTVKDVTKSELLEPEDQTYFLIDYDLAHNSNIYWFRNSLLKNPFLTGLLFTWIPYRDDLTVKIRVNVRRSDGETVKYTASAAAAVYYYNWSSEDTKSAKKNLRKTAINKSVNILQRQMLDDVRLYWSDHTVDQRKQAE